MAARLRKSLFTLGLDDEGRGADKSTWWRVMENQGRPEISARSPVCARTQPARGTMASACIIASSHVAALILPLFVPFVEARSWKEEEEERKKDREWNVARANGVIIYRVR